MSLESIDAALRLVNRELWIVTATHGASRGGLVATWVSSVSIDREHPVMLIGLAPQHFTRELVEQSGCLGLHLIATDQLASAFDFAIGSGRDRDKLQGLETFTAVTGAPLLKECVAWFDCRVFARLVTGDRVFFWADIVAGETIRAIAPAREHDLFAGATAEQKQKLIADRAASVAVQRPAQAAWCRNLPAHFKLSASD
ncbi:MAG TPA: flavin reductase family protein [Pirellulaceae bacterium]|nr:flavin reductase family protein [Pirellulaceae bacterium]